MIRGQTKWVGILLLALAVPGIGFALNTLDTGYQVAVEPVTIDAHGTCYRAVATDGQSYFVPTRTALEWQTFIANKPAGVTLESCTPTSPVLTFMTSFNCPNPYSRMFCGNSYHTSSVSADGRYIFAFENGDSGLTMPKLHIYRVDAAAGQVTWRTTISDLSRYNQPTAAFAATPNGSHILIAARRYSGDGRPVPFALYSFDGTTATRVYSGGRSALGYSAPAIAPNASTFAMDGRIYEANGAGYTVVFDNGQANSMGSGGAHHYLGETRGYYVRRQGGGDIVRRGADGVWRVEQTLTPGGATNSYSGMYSATSHDGLWLAIVSKPNFSSPYSAFLYRYNTTTGLYQAIGTPINLGTSNLYVAFSADGSYLYNALNGWDIRPLLSGGAPVPIQSYITEPALRTYLPSESQTGIVVYPNPNADSGYRGRFYVYKRQ